MQRKHFVRFGILALLTMAFTVPAKAYYPHDAVVNGGFENDPVATGWNVSSGNPIGAWTGTAWHSGTRGAKLGVAPTGLDASATQTITQDVAIPANATKAEFSYWYKWTSAEYATGYDAVEFTALNKADPTEHFCFTWFDPAAPRYPIATQGVWAYVSCDLSTAKGKTVTLTFDVTNDPVYMTYAYIDDVSVQLETSDATAPISSLAIAPAAPDGLNGFYKTIPTITLSATDDANGSGVKSTWYKWDNGDATGIQYTSPFKAMEGNHTLTYWSIDTVNNVETSWKSIFLMVDTTIPTVNTTSVPSASDGSNGYFLSQPSVTLQTSDAAGGSGAGTAYYKIDAGTYTPYTNIPIVIPQGAHTLSYYATDWAGNATVEKTVAYNVDLTNPYIILDPLSQRTISSTTMVTIAGTVTDTGAGVSAVTVNGVNAPLDTHDHFSISLKLNNGKNTVTTVATDFAGRTVTLQRIVTVQQGIVLGASVTAPRATSVTPKMILATKKKNFNQLITVRGTNFDKGARVWIGKTKAYRVLYKNSTTLKVYVPMAKQGKGMWDITVTNGDGQSTTAKKLLKVQ